MSAKGSHSASHQVQKGDVVWVPFRRDPLWPALVQNVYPKKITFAFFPLPKLEPGKKYTSFSCHPRSAFAVSATDAVPANASHELLEAFSAAVKYITEKGWLKGSKAPRRPLEAGLIEMNAETVGATLAESAASSSPAGSVGSSSANEKDTAKENDKGEPKEKAVKTVKKARKESGSVTLLRTETSHGDVDMGEPEEPRLSVTLLQSVIFENLENILVNLWRTDRVRQYVTPNRKDIRVSFEVSHLLSNDDTDRLFEKVVQWVQSRETECRILPALHLTAEILFPEIIIQSIQILHGVSYKDANEIVFSRAQANGSTVDSVSADSFSPSGLDALVAVACEERAKERESV